MSRTHFRRSITAAALAVIMVFAFAVSALAPKAAAAGTFTQHSSGGLTYKLYVPSSYSSSKAAPLVVMLHGCTQDADQFAAGTQMNALAEQEGFLERYAGREPIYLEWADRVVDVQPTPAETARGILEVLNT